MSDVFMAFGLLYMVFSMLFALMWTDSILNDRSFVSYYRNSIKNKNSFEKVYVTIFYLIALPSYLFAVFALYVFLILQGIYELGIRRDDEEDSNV